MTDAVVQRIALGIEYNGQAYAGWQFQTGKATVQAALQNALSVIANQEIVVHCAGRTDTGVHAFEQVVHFDTEVPRPLPAWLRGANTYLPPDIRIIWAQAVESDFHARYQAIARCYRYVILNRGVHSALLQGQATWVHQSLDAERMHNAAQALLGEHDFSSFRAQSCQSVSPKRHLYFVDVYRQQDQVIIDICANAFLHHMVRNIVGSLIEVGRGKHDAEWLADLLALKDRNRAAMTAPPDGLHLLAVYYPASCGIPIHPIFAQLPADASRFD
ncbi:MAG: tRNA pseudouridine(38-40) synthase TruA [Methylococcaceae bacterium]|nr:tRNA pseudouridine(38-40) synthase TruA [Methylococcaceae bacterium]